jgi:hypothetical protein
MLALHYNLSNRFFLDISKIIKHKIRMSQCSELISEIEEIRDRSPGSKQTVQIVFTV